MLRDYGFVARQIKAVSPTATSSKASSPKATDTRSMAFSPNAMDSQSLSQLSPATKSDCVDIEIPDDDEDDAPVASAITFRMGPVFEAPWARQPFAPKAADLKEIDDKIFMRLRRGDRGVAMLFNLNNRARTPWGHHDLGVLMYLINLRNATVEKEMTKVVIRDVDPGAEQSCEFHEFKRAKRDLIDDVPNVISMTIPPVGDLEKRTMLVLPNVHNGAVFEFELTHENMMHLFNMLHSDWDVDSVKVPKSRGGKRQGFSEDAPDILVKEDGGIASLIYCYWRDAQGRVHQKKKQIPTLSKELALEVAREQAKSMQEFFNSHHVPDENVD